MSNSRRDLPRLRKQKPSPEVHDERLPISDTSRAADVVSLQRVVGNQGMQNLIAQQSLLQTQMAGGNRSRSSAIQRTPEGWEEESPEVSDDGSFIQFPTDHVRSGDGGSPQESDDGSFIQFPPDHVPSDSGGGGNTSPQESDDGSYIEFPPDHIPSDSGGGGDASPQESDDGSFIQFPPDNINEWW